MHEEQEKKGRPMIERKGWCAEEEDQSDLPAKRAEMYPRAAVLLTQQPHPPESRDRFTQPARRLQSFHRRQHIGIASDRTGRLPELWPTSKRARSAPKQNQQ